MRKKNQKIHITTTFTVGIVAISFISTVVFAAFITISEIYHYKSVSKEMHNQYTKSQKLLLKTEVDRVIDYIEHEKEKAYKKLQADIKSRVDEAYTVAESIYNQNNGKIPAGEIIKLVVETLRNVRFKNGRGYYFAADLDGNIKLYPENPDLENRNSFNMQGMDGKYVIRDMISLVKKEGEGFYSYHWTKPGTDGKISPKIAYIKHFEPFDWFIGTGEYLDDEEEDIKKNVIERIEKIKFGNNGYVFAGDFNGISKARPAKNENMWDVQDVNGIKIVQQLIARAKNGGGFVSYVMPRLDGLPDEPKLSYADKIDDWQWYIGAGIYVDEINTVLAKQDKALKDQLFNLILILFFTLLGVIAITFFAARVFASRLGKSINSFSHFFNMASGKAKKIDLSTVHFSEFTELAQSANQMVEENSKANLALLESFEWIQSILNTTQSGIIVIDSEKHEVADVNPAACEMIGLPKESIVGRPCHDFICPAEVNKCPILDLDQEIDHEERVLKRPDGEDIPILKTVIKTEMSGRAYLIESFQDLSRQKKLEIQLQQTQKMEGIGTLAGGIAHDFNNILSPIIMHSEMAMDELPDDSPLQTCMKEIYKAGMRARDLVKQILTFARKGSEELIVLRASMVVGEAVNFLRSTIPTTIDIRYELEAEQDTIFADPTQVNQIIMNLCTNAAHAMKETGGLIEVILDNEDIASHTHKNIGSLSPGRYLRIIVHDTGTGIPPNIIKKIFDPYFTTKSQGEGTGLGLAIIHGIAKNCGGDVTVSSIMGSGTTFTVYLPVINEDASEQVQEKQPLQRGQERILLVDDEEAGLKVMQTMLERLGYKVTARAISSVALNAFRHNPDSFDLVITDMTMPNLTGKDMAIEIKKIRPDMPIILCTGFSDQIDEDEAKSLGISAFIYKPIITKEITKTIREVLD